MANTNDNFGLWNKWFWIGIVLGFFSLLSGLIFGIALICEKEHRREGLLIILISLIFFVLKTFLLAPWLSAMGYLPQYDLVK